MEGGSTNALSVNWFTYVLMSHKVQFSSNSWFSSSGSIANNHPHIKLFSGLPPHLPAPKISAYSISWCTFNGCCNKVLITVIVDLWWGGLTFQSESLTFTIWKSIPAASPQMHFLREKLGTLKCLVLSLSHKITRFRKLYLLRGKQWKPGNALFNIYRIFLLVKVPSN